MATISKARPLLVRLRVQSWQLFAVIALTLVGFWLVLDWIFPLEMWAVDNDYVAYSLGLALNIQRWVETGGWRLNEGIPTFHDPLQLAITSWFALKVAGLLNDAGNSPLAQMTLRDPRGFWAWNQIFTILITLGSAAALWRSARAFPPIWRLAALAAYFTFQPAWLYSLEFLGNDTFALIFAVPFFHLARAYFLSSYQRREQNVLLLAVGSVGAFAFFIKANYLVWTFGFCIGLLVQSIFARRDIIEILLRVTVVLFGFAIMFAVLALAFNGPDGTIAALVNPILFFNSPNASTTAQSPTGWLLQLAITAIAMLLHPDLWAASAAVLVLVILVCLRRRHDAAWNVHNVPFVAAMAATILTTYALYMRLPQGHYLLPAAAALTCLVCWVGIEAEQFKKFRLVLLSTIAVLVSFSGVVSLATRLHDINYYALANTEVNNILTLPLDHDSKRLWSWRVESREFLDGFAIELSATRNYYASDLADVLPNDFVYDVWTDRVGDGRAQQLASETNWQYAVFDRRRYADASNLPQYFRSSGSVILETETLWVFRKNT